MARIVIVGDGETAELAYEYFTCDSPHEVVAFAVEREFAKKDRLFDLPVIHFEEMERLYPPAEYKAFVAISYATQSSPPATLSGGEGEGLRVRLLHQFPCLRLAQCRDR